MARIVAVGLLLVAVTVAAGCDSVKARERGDAKPHPALGRSLAVPAGITSRDVLPTFAPVPPHAELPTFDHAAYLGHPLTDVRNDKHEVALTFDDGPSENSAKILEILRAQDAHATFFVVGWRAKKDDGAIVSAVVQGDEIANHTWSHRSLRHLDETMTAQQVDRTQAMLRVEAGSAPIFVRPRGGKYDESGQRALTDRGLILALWSIKANDIHDALSPSDLVKTATAGAKSGSIILLHETNPNTVRALPNILAALRAKGLHSVTLSQLLADGHP